MSTTLTLPCPTCGYVGTSACPRCGWINAEIRRCARIGALIAPTRRRLDALADWQARMDYRRAFGVDAPWPAPSDEGMDADGVVHEGERVNAIAA